MKSLGEIFFSTWAFLVASGWAFSIISDNHAQPLFNLALLCYFIRALPTKFRASGEMVDTLALGASGGNPVEVQVLSRPPINIRC